MSSRWDRDDGSAAVELAMLAPLFALLIAALIQGASLVQTAEVVRNAAREGARYAAVSDSDPAGKALAYLQGTFGSRTDVTLPAKASITVSGSVVGSPVTVTVPVSVAVNAPIIRNIVGSSVPLSASATMRITQ